MSSRILIAEDEEITLKYILSALEKEGYEVTGVLDGRSALEKIDNGIFDILIADIKMPGLTGIELLGIVRERNLETEVIIITGYGSITSVVDAMKKGARDYITKPFDLEELILKVKQIHEEKMLKRRL
jgi:DNA-binding NtrC family response regulator